MTTSAWNQPGSPKGLRDLHALYERARSETEHIGDEEFLAAVAASFWGTNCFSYAEGAFTMIAPGCKLRPHLTRALLVHPIRALIEGGVDEPGSVIEFGTAIATSPNPYVAVTPEGRQWLLEELPRLAPIVHDVFSTELSEMERMAGEDD